jgi:class 3 adenylate cyclase
MPIRIKILSIAVALLLVFGIVIGISAVLQRQVGEEVADIGRYHRPLAGAMADFDVLSDEYELLALRLVRRSDVKQSDVEAADNRAQQVAEEMKSDLITAESVIARGIADDDVPVQSRLVLARLQGLVSLLDRKVPPYLAVGQQIFDALKTGRLEDARQLSLDFRGYEEAFGPDTAEVRRAAIQLTDTAIASVHTKQMAIEYMGYVLFAIAACLGIGIGLAVATAVIRTLRHLLEAAKAVEGGELAVAVPIRSRDEIGQLAVAFNAMIEELRTKERIKDTFGKFIDPRIVSGLIGTDTANVDQADRRVVTVFFSDIMGFTGISEQLTAAAMVNLLNHYFDAVTRCIRSNHGIVDKYIGDAVMAFWSPPFSVGDSHATAACIAALAQQQAIELLQSELPNIVGLRRNAPNLIVRMGIATGEAVVGTIGSPVSKSFTVIGDTVNLASRLEGINKVYGTRIIIAEETLRLAQHEVEARELDLITVAGKTEPVRIYELLAPFGLLAPGDADLREEFACGLTAYRAREWDTAEHGFAECRRLKPTDGPSALFLERVQRLRAEAPPADWDGVWRFTHK